MPANPASLVLTSRYHERVDRLARSTGKAVAGRFAAVDRENLSESLQAFVVDAISMLAAAQGAAKGLSAGYFAALSALETGRVQQTAGADVVGHATDGRELGPVMGVVPARVYVALKQGKSIDQALSYGRFGAEHRARTEVMDAARSELDAHMADAPVKGWRWRSKGTCGACLALDDGAVREGLMETHPGCQCVPEPAFEVPETVEPETGHERFLNLPVSEQDALLGVDLAQGIRSGAIAWGDLVVTEHNPRWHDFVTAASATQAKRRARRR